MEQNNAGAVARADLAYPATTDQPSAIGPVTGKVGLSYLKFMIAALVAFMLLIIGKIESGDASNHAAGRVLLLLALASALYAVFELARGLIGGKGRPDVTDPSI